MCVTIHRYVYPRVAVDDEDNRGEDDDDAPLGLPAPKKPHRKEKEQDPKAAAHRAAAEVCVCLRVYVCVCLSVFVCGCLLSCTASRSLAFSFGWLFVFFKFCVDRSVAYHRRVRRTRRRPCPAPSPPRWCLIPQIDLRNPLRLCRTCHHS